MELSILESAQDESAIAADTDRRASIRKLWAGPGSGRRCEYCRAPIWPEALEFEVELTSGNLCFHRVCLHLWEGSPGELNGN
jgi:hypothetical protein